jgi:hypothetical protein
MAEKYSDVEVKRIVENEGLDYALLHYLSPEQIDNPELKKLWTEAKKLWTEAAHVLGVLDDFLDCIEDDEDF